MKKLVYYYNVASKNLAANLNDINYNSIATQLKKMHHPTGTVIQRKQDSEEDKVYF